MLVSQDVNGINEVTFKKIIKVSLVYTSVLISTVMILYIENLYATRKLLVPINEFSKVKSLAFLYTNYERSEREIKETVSFHCNKKTKIHRNKRT